MSGLSLSLDTTQLAEAYEKRSADRQFKNGKRLVARWGLRPGDRVLDLGSGTGLLAEHVASLVGETGSVLGIDPLPLRIAIAEKKRTVNLAFSIGDAYKLDGLASSSFDVVYLNAVLHWLPEKSGPRRRSTGRSNRVVACRAQHVQPSAEAAIEFSNASSFGNYLGHLPADLRASAIEEIKREVETLRSAEGIRLDTARIIAVASKPAAH
jgi:SAM-dependent methyltransferase